MIHMPQTQGNQRGEGWKLWRTDKRDIGLARAITVKQVPSWESKGSFGRQEKTMETG